MLFLGYAQVESIIIENRGRTTPSGRPIIEKIETIYGNIRRNKIEGDKIYQATTKTIYDFYDLNKGKNFVVVIDSIQNHFLTIPFNILKDVMYDRESGKDINKNFHISRNPYTLQRNK